MRGKKHHTSDRVQRRLNIINAIYALGSPVVIYTIVKEASEKFPDQMGTITILGLCAFVAVEAFLVFRLREIANADRAWCTDVLKQWTLEPLFVEQKNHFSFSERKWLFRKIDDWSKLGHKLLLITGPTGMGKTEIAREFIRKNKPLVVAYHFCSHQTPRTLWAIDFLRNLAAMLNNNIPEYSRALFRQKDYHQIISDVNDNERAWSDGGIELFFPKIVGDPLKRLDENRRKGLFESRLETLDQNRLKELGGNRQEMWWIVIDALDETVGVALDKETGGTVVNALIDCLAKLPGWIRIIATTRDEDDVNLSKLATFITSDDKITLNMPDQTSSDFYNNLVVKDTEAYIEALWRDRERQNSILTRICALFQVRPSNLNEDKRRILTASQGNFLLTKLNFDEFYPRRRDRTHQVEMADSVYRRYELTFDRLFKASMEEYYKKTVRPLLATILATEETQPLTEGLLGRATDTDIDGLHELLGQLQSHLMIESGIRTFHKSFSDWLTSADAGRYKIDKGMGAGERIIIVEGERSLVKLCIETLKEIKTKPNGMLRNFIGEGNMYLRRHGVKHFTTSAKAHFPEAVKLVSLLLKTRDLHDEWGLVRSASPQHLAREVLLRLADYCPDEQMKAIDPDHLAELVCGCYQIDPLPSALTILVMRHYDQFSKRHRARDNDREEEPIIDKLLRTENYVLRYELSNIIGDQCAEGNSDFNIDWIKRRMDHKDINHRELGRYALRRLYVRPMAEGKGDPIEVDLLNELGDRENPTYVGGQVLGETLLNLALQGRSYATKIDQSLVSEQQMIWDHNLLNLWDIRAIDFDRNGGRELQGVHEESAYRDLRETENRRKQLEADRATDKKIRAFLEMWTFYSLGGDEKPLKEAKIEICKLDNDRLDGLMRLLFSHPSWNVGENAASILESIFEMDTKRADYIENKIIRKLWRDENWRIRLGGIEAAYILSGVSEELFFEAVLENYDHDCCRVRGLCAEDLITYMLERPTQLRSHIKKFSDCIEFWLSRENDCWVLEHIYHFLTSIARDDELRGNCDYHSLVRSIKSPFLKVGLTWEEEISREKFLKHIQTIKKTEVSRRPKNGGRIISRRKAA